MSLPNTRSDLESLRGTPAFEVCLRDIFGSMTTWTLADGAWVAEEDLRVIERLDYTKADFLAEVEALDIPPPSAPATPTVDQPVIVVFAVDLWSRMSDDEVADVEAAMAAQSARIRNIFRAANSYRSDHELWSLLESMAESLFGAERAAEILAPS